MQPLAGISEPRGAIGGGTAYDAVQVQALLTASDVVEDWAVDLLDLNLRPKANLSPQVSRGGGADIAHDSTAAVKRTLKLPVISGTALSIPLLPSDLIRVWYKLAAPDGGWLRWPIGTFMQSAPAAVTSTPAGSWLAITASELLKITAETTFETSYATSAGQTYMSAIQGILKLAGSLLARPGMCNIPDSGRTMSAPIGWDAGTSLLTAINDLLIAVGYMTAYTDAYGVVTSRPLPDFSLTPPVFTFDTTTGHAVVVGQILRQPDDGKVINACKVVGEDARSQPVSEQYVNMSADSPISVLRLGRTKLLLIKDSKIADAGSALARAHYEVALAAANYAPITLNTFAWPFSENLDTFQLIYQTPDEGLVKLLVVEEKWSHHVGAGGYSAHTLNAVVAV